MADNPGSPSPWSQSGGSTPPGSPPLPGATPPAAQPGATPPGSPPPESHPSAFAPRPVAPPVIAPPVVSPPPIGGNSISAQAIAATSSPRPSAAQVARIKALYDRITGEVAKIYVGQEELVLGALVALFSSGHVLIESVPGLGKTLFVRVLGRVLGCQCGRIQFTADLMPSDITGAPIFDMKQQEFRFRPGPVFTQFLLADEINRSPAKTHAALLEIMQEYHVTVERTTHKLKRPFLVLATQNPLESEGTYNLPEAQLDRFMFKIIADYPSVAEEILILKQHGQQKDLDTQLAKTLQTVTSPEEIVEITTLASGVHIEDQLFAYINQLVRATRQWPHFHLGASPRAGIALVQGSRTMAAFRGRDYVVPDDVVDIVLPALRHRVVLTAEAEVEGQTTDEQLRELVRSIEVPRL